MHFYHFFHILKPSLWPLVISFELLIFMVEALYGLSSPLNNLFFLSVSLGLISLTILFWLNDITIEGVYNRHHTEKVTQSLRLGAILFIISEIMLFVGFFWAFFHSFLAPSHTIGCLWPPLGVEPLNPYKLPLANTMILLTSGATVTLAHHAFLKEENKNIEPQANFVEDNKKFVVFAFILTILLGIFFTTLQLVEYKNASFSINTGIYGSVFFLLTGLHGVHVILGSMMLMYTLVRFLANHFTANNHFAFQFSALYWHFIDVIWLILFITLYMSSDITLTGYTVILFFGFYSGIKKFIKKLFFRFKFVKIIIFIIFLIYLSYHFLFIPFVFQALIWYYTDSSGNSSMSSTLDLPESEVLSEIIDFENYRVQEKKLIKAYLREKLSVDDLKIKLTTLKGRLNLEDSAFLKKHPINLNNIIHELVKEDWGTDDLYTIPNQFKQLQAILARPFDGYRYMLTSSGNLPEFSLSSSYYDELDRIKALYEEGQISKDKYEALRAAAKSKLSMYDESKLVRWHANYSDPITKFEQKNPFNPKNQKK